MEVAFCWTGSQAHVKDRFRSTPLHLWFPLFALPITWHSLVVQEDAESLPTMSNVIDHRGELKDFLCTAHLIEQCDLTITVDTATAHLAGSLSKPYWLLLPNPPEWRWGTMSTSTVWYPLAILYRQPAPGAWEPVFARIHADLSALLAGCATQIVS